MNRLKAQRRIKVQNEPWWWARVTLPCCRESHSLKRRANRSLALLVQSVGRRGGAAAAPPARCTGTGPPFRGENRAFEPTQAWQGVSWWKCKWKVEALPFFCCKWQNRFKLHTKPIGSNYMVNMKCLSPGDCGHRKHLFVHQGQDLIKHLVVAQCPKSALLCNYLCTWWKWLHS